MTAAERREGDIRYHYITEIGDTTGDYQTGAILDIAGGSPSITSLYNVLLLAVHRECNPHLWRGKQASRGGCRSTCNPAGQ